MTTITIYVHPELVILVLAVILIVQIKSLIEIIP